MSASFASSSGCRPSSTFVPAIRRKLELDVVFGRVVAREHDVRMRLGCLDVERLEREVLAVDVGHVLEVGERGQRAPGFVRPAVGQVAIAAGAVAQRGDAGGWIVLREVAGVDRRRNRAGARAGDEHRLGTEEVLVGPVEGRSAVRIAAVVDRHLARRCVLGGRHLVDRVAVADVNVAGAVGHEDEAVVGERILGMVEGGNAVGRFLSRLIDARSGQLLDRGHRVGGIALRIAGLGVPAAAPRPGGRRRAGSDRPCGRRTGTANRRSRSWRRRE